MHVLPPDPELYLYVFSVPHSQLTQTGDSQRHWLVICINVLLRILHVLAGFAVLCLMGELEVSIACILIWRLS